MVVGTWRMEDEDKRMIRCRYSTGLLAILHTGSPIGFASIDEECFLKASIVVAKVSNQLFGKSSHDKREGLAGGDLTGGGLFGNDNATAPDNTALSRLCESSLYSSMLSPPCLISDYKLVLNIRQTKR
ncbi:hypothetical protein WA026_006043 [Henosepilachna vigintioctopunctata]|uniref:Uncharacterized protein n=1 Tax=Henosepilachna vigintioctopunctata TaxID=420089 RepID=A0AAW1TQA4_9CUCU